MKYKCKYCGKEFDIKQKLAGHTSKCKLNPNYERNMKYLEDARSKIKMNSDGTYIRTHKDEKCSCQYCGRLYRYYGLKNHETYCIDNPNRKQYPVKENHEWNFSKHPGSGWNKGLTKETDERLKKQGESYKEGVKNGTIIPWFTGKHWSEEQKQHFSEKTTKYYLEHPDKIPYKLYHSSNISYPEQYFIDVFKKENIDLKYHLQVGLYELDFYNEKQKVYVEIDGDTHKQKRVQEIDRRKDEYLNSLGWKGMRIDWSSYQKLSDLEKQKLINNIKNFILQVL